MLNHFRNPVVVLLIALIFPLGCFAKMNSVQAGYKRNMLPIGSWRGEIIRPDDKPIVLNFQTKRRSGKIIIYIINGAERLLVNEVRQKKDSLFIKMPFYDSYFAL